MPSTPRWSIHGNAADLQRPHDVAVVMPSIGRREIVRALDSVFRQQGVARIQLLIGIDRSPPDLSFLDDALQACPAHVTACVFDPGYSTSVRHGGVMPARDGGALRCVLTGLANARYVAYLDDDNWWREDHLSSLLAVIEGKAWAFSLRQFVHPESGQPLCVDEWESVGPGRGVFQARFGGFVDPNCLMIDKLQCWQCLALWNVPLKDDAKGMSADRNVFNFLRSHSAPGETGQPSALYRMDPGDGLHAMRVRLMGDRYR